MRNKRQIPVPSNASDVERCWLKARGKTILNVPLESALSFPIPIITDSDKIFLLGFYYGIQKMGGPGIIIVKNPFARITVSYPDAENIQFHQEPATELFPDVNVNDDLGFLPTSVLSPAEKVQKRRDLYKLLTELIPKFSFDAQINGEVQDCFRRDFDIVIEQPLVAYYYSLNPLFFSWLGF